MVPNASVRCLNILIGVAGSEICVNMNYSGLVLDIYKWFKLRK